MWPTWQLASVYVTPGRAGPPLNLSSPCLGSPPPLIHNFTRLSLTSFSPPPPAMLTYAALPVLFCITGLLSRQLPAHCVPHV